MRSILLAAAVAFIFAGCTSNKPEPPKTDAGGIGGAAKDATGAGATIANAALSNVEVACAHCVYHKAGVTSCAPAVKVGNTVHTLSGDVKVDMAGLGLCKAAKMAAIEGKIEGDKVVATKIAYK